MNDYEELITTREQLDEIVKKYVPNHLKPGHLVGLKGVDITSKEYVDEHILNENTLMISLTKSKLFSVVDIGGMFGVIHAMMGTQNPYSEDEDDYVVFITEGLPFYATVFFLLVGVILIETVSTKGAGFAASKQGGLEAMKTAKNIINNVFDKEASQMLFLIKRFLKKN